MLKRTLLLSSILVSLINLVICLPIYSMNNHIEKTEANQLKYFLSVDVNRIKSIGGHLYFQILSCNLKELADESKLETTLEIVDSISFDTLPVVKQGHIKVEQSNFKLFSFQLPPGDYIVRIFQDLNKNETLDLSPNGIPLEPVGFSNNPSLAFGSPEVEKICFPLKYDLDLKIKLKNKRKKRRSKRS